MLSLHEVSGQHKVLDTLSCECNKVVSLIVLQEKPFCVQICFVLFSDVVNFFHKNRITFEFRHELKLALLSVFVSIFIINFAKNADTTFLYSHGNLTLLLIIWFT